MDDCIHGLDPAWCDLCTRPREPHQPILDRITERPKGRTQAYFEGLCLRCEQSIGFGEWIGLDDHYGWIHLSHFDLSGW